MNLSFFNGHYEESKIRRFCAEWRPMRQIAIACLLILSVCRPPKQQDLNFQRGLNAMAQGRYDWARHYFIEDLRENPERPDSLRALGLAWVAGYEGSLSNGVAVFRQYMALRPDDDQIQIELAKALLRLGQKQEARFLAVAADDSLQSNQLLAEIELQDNSASALKYILRALEIDPDSYRSQLLAAKIYQALAQYETALIHANLAAYADPFPKATFYILSQLHREMGEPEKAEKSLAVYELLDDLPENSMPNRLTLFEELALMNKLKDLLASDSPKFQMTMCRLLWETGQRDEAEHLLDLIESKIDLMPQHWLVFADLAAELGKTQLAIIYYERFAAENTDNGVSLLKRAELATRMGDLVEAKKLLKRGLEQYPNHAPFLYSLGTISLGQNQLEEAEMYLIEALEVAPWQTTYRITLADIYLSDGRLDAFEQLLRQSPSKDKQLENYKSLHLGN